MIYTKIGRVLRVVKDNSRDEIFNSSKEKRTIIMSIFYPAEEQYCSGEGILYKDLFKPHTEIFIEDVGNTKEAIEYINKLRTDVFLNVPIKNGVDKYPVIIYSPGIFQDRDFAIFTVVNIVKEGYIVITLGSLYETDYIIMPNGDVIRATGELQKEMMGSITDKTWRHLRDIRKRDMLFMVDHVFNINKKDELLKDRIDINSIGAMGFSLGAQSTFEAMADDKRIKAAVLLDGSFDKSTVWKKINNGEKCSTPVLLFKSHAASYDLKVEQAKAFYENIEDKEMAEGLIKKAIIEKREMIEAQKALYHYLEGYKSFVKIQYTDHAAFCDIPILLNLQYAECFHGKISSKKVHEIVSMTSLKFFNEFLRHRDMEYQNFIKNNYVELKKINAEGEVIR